MAGDNRGEYKPRRARLDDDVPDSDAELPSAPGPWAVDSPAAAPTATEPPAAESPAAEIGRGQRENQQLEPTPQPTTEQRVAAAKRAERLVELQQLRDRTPGARIDKADRPDVGHRRNTVDPVLRPQRRGRGIAAGVIAVVIVGALIAGYLAWSNHRQTPTARPPAQPTTAADTTMINQHTMLTPALAQTVIKQRWRITADQPAGTGDSPVPACLADPQDEAPTPVQGEVRTLSTSTNGPTALHLAEAYKSSELAAESFALIAKSLGECNLRGSYISSARVITGLGDQASAVLLHDPATDGYRAVVANRTGQLVNVIDIAETKNSPDLDKTVAALGKLTDLQCTLAIGICATYPRVADGPPPVSGDEPGFLALADIPVPTSNHGTWGGLAPGSPADVVTSGCENVDFKSLPAAGRAARSYVLVDKPKGMPTTFGLDEITLTMKSAKDASQEAKTIGTNIKNCADRQPTAKISEFGSVTGVGANSTQITGSVALVTQKMSPKSSSTFRVGVAAAGAKLVYTFLPRTDSWDLTTTQWAGLTVRAAQRATQVR